MTITESTSQQISINGLVAGYEGMSVATYFEQQGYSLKAPAKPQTLNAQNHSSLMAAQQLHEKTPTSNPKVSHEKLGAASHEASC